MSVTCGMIVSDKPQGYATLADLLSAIRDYERRRRHAISLIDMKSVQHNSTSRVSRDAGKSGVTQVPVA